MLWIGPLSANEPLLQLSNRYSVENILPSKSILVEIPIQWELDDAPYFSYAPSLGSRNLMASPEHVYQVWSAAFDGMYHYGRSFVLTMHPFVTGRPGRLRMLERLIQHMRELPGVEFMTALDLARMWVRHSAPGAT